MDANGRLVVLELHRIVFDKELQVRVEINEDTAHDYYEAMATEEDVDKFPPPTVYFDGCNYWLADGHHRYLAAHRRGFQKMTVRVIDGTHDEAILAAVKLNMNHGLRFNRDDWERIVELIAGKEQWKDLSNRELARLLGCDDKTIRKYRPENSVADASATEKRRGKDGKMYKTRKIRQSGKKKNPESSRLDTSLYDTKAPLSRFSNPEDLAHQLCHLFSANYSLRLIKCIAERQIIMKPRDAKVIKQIIAELENKLKQGLLQEQ